jgi:hypothetical protein
MSEEPQAGYRATERTGDVLCRKRYAWKMDRRWTKLRLRGEITGSSVLQEDGEAEEDAAEDSGKAQTSVGHEDGASAALVVGVVVGVAAVAVASLRGTTEAGDGDGV